MILDTNTYAALVQGKASVSEVFASSHTICLPLPVIAELKQGFLGGSMPTQNKQRLEQFMAGDLVEILIPTVETTEHYAALQHYARRKGRVLSNNDIWIAALTLETGDTLVTYDKDFQVFNELLGDGLIILSE